MPAIPDAIYVRTPRGQNDVGSHDLPLQPAARRLLMLVNGFTPLDHLADRLHPHDVAAARDVLLSLGLIEAVRVDAGLQIAC